VARGHGGRRTRQPSRNGVGGLNRWRVVQRREIVLNGPSELRQNRAAPLERLDRSQRVPASAVSGERATWEPSTAVFMPSSPPEIVVAYVPEKGFFSGTGTTLDVRQDGSLRGSYAQTMPSRALDDLAEIELPQSLPLS